MSVAEGGNDAGKRQFLIVNKKGLHARASAKFVELAGSFDAKLTVSKDGQSVGGTSIMGLMMLAAGKDSVIEVSADGVEGQAALDAIGRLIEDRFGEEA